jgi:hypothetical protein
VIRAYFESLVTPHNKSDLLCFLVFYCGKGASEQPGRYEEGREIRTEKLNVTSSTLFPLALPRRLVETEEFSAPVRGKGHNERVSNAIKATIDSNRHNSTPKDAARKPQTHPNASKDIALHLEPLGFPLLASLGLDAVLVRQTEDGLKVGAGLLLLLV